MNRTVGAALRARAAAAPDADLVKCGKQWLSAGEVDAISDRVAAGLVAQGITTGDRIALLVPNRQEMLELFFAGAKLGAIQVPLNTFLKGEFLRHQLADSGASALVVDAAGYRAAAPLLGASTVKQVILLDEIDTEQSPVDTVAYEVIRQAQGPAPIPELESSSPLSIMYTSGTTGLPKGCVMPHGYYTASGKTFLTAGLVEPGERIFTAFPLFHAGGQVISLMAGVMNDGAVCYEPGFSASQFLARAREERATMLWGVGMMGSALLAQPPSPSDREHDLRLAAWVPMAPDAQLAFEERFGVPVTSEMFGQTECLPITLSRIGGERNRASLGQPLEHLDVKIVDDDGQEVARGEVGEIVVRPRADEVMFLGYWDAATADVTPRKGEWHHTGDSGRADADGFLTFVDRKKDSLRRRGENISSFELEAAISRHPAVARVAITAVPSPLGEDDVKASVVFKEGQTPSAEELFAYFRDELPYFAIPRYVDVRDALPVNAMDRVMKHVLRDEGVPEDAWDLEALGLVVEREQRRS